MLNYYINILSGSFEVIENYVDLLKECSPDTKLQHIREAPCGSSFTPPALDV